MPTVTFSSGIIDTMLQQEFPTATAGIAKQIGVDTGTGVEVQALLAFSNLFGTGPGQIPLGATITSATLTLQTTNPSNQGGSLYRMLADWNAQSTWNSFNNGIQFDGLEAMATPDYVTGAVALGSRGFDVTKSLQAWSTGAVNHGWVIKAASTDGWDFYSSEGTTKPTLTVTYTTDTQPPPSPVVSIQNASQTEGPGAKMLFTVNLSAAAGTGGVVVHYATQNGSATAADGTNSNDFIGVADGLLSFAQGETSKTIEIALNDDTVQESTETFSVHLTSATGATVSPSNGTATGTIIDNDTVTPPPSPVASIQNASQTEGPGAKMVFTVSLSAAAGAGGVTVNYATQNGTATAADGTNPNDFIGVTNGMLSFAQGETSKTFEITLNDDTIQEGNETFSVKLTSATGATVSASNGTATGTIVDNDSSAPPPIQAKVVAVTDTTTQVFKNVDQTGYGIGDPSGLAYVPGLNKLFIADSEHDETPYFSNTNLFSIGPNGVIEGYNLGATFSVEPTGLAYNPKNGYLYMTDDDARKVFWVDPSNPTVKLGEFSTVPYGADSEDPKFDPVTGHMFMLDGESRKMFELTADGALVRSISLPSVMTDGEALAYDSTHDVFFVGNGSTSKIWEMDRDGNVLATLDIFANYRNPLSGWKPSIKGLELAPSSDPNDGNKLSLYVADYGVDQKNDGRLLEVDLGPGWFTA